MKVYENSLKLLYSKAKALRIARLFKRKKQFTALILLFYRFLRYETALQVQL